MRMYVIDTIDLQLFPTTTAINQARRVVDMSRRIAELEPEEAPLTAILRRARGRRREAINPEFKWLEVELKDRIDAVNNATGYAPGDTALVVDNASLFKVGNIVKVTRTGEILRVTGVDTATNTLTVVRGYGETAAAAINDDDELIILGVAMEERSNAPAEEYFDPSDFFNYTQIFRTPFGASRTLEVSELYGGRDRPTQRRLFAKQHNVDMERAFLFGERKLDTTGPRPRRMTRGLISFIKTNVYDAGGALTQTEFEGEFAEMAFRFGSKTKLLLASLRLLSTINSFASDRLRTRPRERTFGLQVQEYITAHGRFLLIPHPLLEGQRWGDAGIVVDPRNVRYRPLRGRDTKLNIDIQSPDEDGWVDEYITEAGLEVQLEKTHAILEDAAA